MFGIGNYLACVLMVVTRVQVKPKNKGVMRYLKGSVMLLAAMLLLPCGEAFSQLFFTGGMGAGVESASTKTVSDVPFIGKSTLVGPAAKNIGEFYPSAQNGLTASFNLNVGVGYMFSEKLGAGMSLGYHLRRQGAHTYAKFENSGDVTKGKEFTSVHTATIAPYLRFKPVSVAGFSVYMDCGVPMEFGGASRYSKSEMKGNVNENSEKLGSVISAGVGVTPGVMYNFTDRLAIYANFRFLQIGYTYTQFSHDKSALPLYTTSITERFHQFNLGKLGDGMELGLCFSL